MKAQPLAEKLLDELTGFDQNILLSEFKQRRYLLECDKAIRVYPAEGYMCKAVVYALSNDFDKMYENFNIAMKLDPSDKLIKINFIASLGNFGRFEEIKEFFRTQTVLDNSPLTHAYFRTLITTLDLDVIKQVDESYANVIYKSLSEINVDLDDAKKYINLFNNLMYQKKIRFGLVPSISWKVHHGDLFVYYDFVGSALRSIEIMDEFDRLVLDADLKSVARNLIIVLLPAGTC